MDNQTYYDASTSDDEYQIYPSDDYKVFSTIRQCESKDAFTIWIANQYACLHQKTKTEGEDFVVVSANPPIPPENTNNKGSSRWCLIL